MKCYLLVLLAALFLISCSDDDNASNIPEETIKIGVLMPLTGAGASTGIDAKSAIDLAIEASNNSLTGMYYKLEYVFKDTETNPDVALEKIQELKEDGIKIVIGPYSSASVDKVRGYADQNDMLIVSPSSVAISLAIEDDNVFRLAPNDEHQSKAIVKAMRQQGIVSFVAAIRDDVWGYELTSEVTDLFVQSGGTGYLTHSYETDQTDFSNLVEKMDENVESLIGIDGADNTAVYMVSFSEGADILEAANNSEYLGRVKWFGASAFAKNNFIETNTIAATYAAERSLSCPVFGYDDSAKDIWEPIVNAIGGNPSIYALCAYDAVMIAGLTYKNLGVEANFSDIKTNYFENANLYSGATGRTKLDVNGDRENGLYDFWNVVDEQGSYVWKKTAVYYGETDTYTEL